MPRNNNDVPVEPVGIFTLRVYHSFEPLRYVIDVPEIHCRFSATTLANVAANAAQGLLFHLYEKQKRVEQLQPGQPH